MLWIVINRVLTGVKSDGHEHWIGVLLNALLRCKNNSRYRKRKMCLGIVMYCRKGLKNKSDI